MMPFMKLAVTLLATMLLQTALYAADLSGTVTVTKKGSDKPLDSFENAIVYLSGTTSPAPESPAIVNQIDKVFEPRLLPVIKGQKVEFWNRDKIMHNVFSTDERNPFDLGRYPKDEQRTVTFNTEGMYKVYCNIHQKMITDIVVVPNRHFTVTDEQGRYTIKDVPPGSYEIRIWHIFGGHTGARIEVKDAPLVKDFTITSEKVIREIEAHKDKNGRRYRKAGRYGR